MGYLDDCFKLKSQFTMEVGRDNGLLKGRGLHIFFCIFPLGFVKGVPGYAGYAGYARGRSESGEK